YFFCPIGVEELDKVRTAIFMFVDLFGLTRFDKDSLIRFTLTVKKNYRRVPYHNWTHGFSVANSMYTIIKHSPKSFRPLECLALFVGSLCHDLDHRGKNNKFMLETESPLAAIYTTSTLEHHHFNQTVTILQQDGHNIFGKLTSNEYKQVLGNIKHCILATDLAMFFPNKAKVNQLLEEKTFDWDNTEHRIAYLYLCGWRAHWKGGLQGRERQACKEVEAGEVGTEETRAGESGEANEPAAYAGNTETVESLEAAEVEVTGLLIEAIAMTACDLCASAKPWDIQVETVKVIFEEFYEQGDAEKAAGKSPIPMMDRDKMDDQADSQVGFLSGICMPCYELLFRLLPITEPLLLGCKKNLDTWKQIAEDKKKLMESKQQEEEGEETDTGIEEVNEDDEEQTVEEIDDDCSETKDSNQKGDGT
ncbi:hypothetical protein SK128_016611, partial [Halocaridina rubra]